MPGYNHRNQWQCEQMVDMQTDACNSLTIINKILLRGQPEKHQWADWDTTSINFHLCQMKSGHKRWHFLLKRMSRGAEICLLETWSNKRGDHGPSIWVVATLKDNEQYHFSEGSHFNRWGCSYILFYLWRLAGPSGSPVIYDNEKNKCALCSLGQISQNKDIFMTFRIKQASIYSTT